MIAGNEKPIVISAPEWVYNNSLFWFKIAGTPGTVRWLVENTLLISNVVLTILYITSFIIRT